MGSEKLTDNLTPLTQTSDTRLVEKAIRQRWEIPEELRQELPAMLRGVVLFGESERNRIAAARALLTADSINQEQERWEAGHTDQPAITVNVGISLSIEERRKRLLEIIGD